MNLKRSTALLIGVLLGAMSASNAAERPISVAALAGLGSRAEAIAFAEDLRRVIADDASIFTLAKSGLDVDVWIQIQNVGPAGYRHGPDWPMQGRGVLPSVNRIYFGCLVVARVTAMRALPVEIEHRDDADCHQAAHGLLRGIKGLLRPPREWRETI